MKNKFALFIYHNEKNGFEKWEFRRDIETGSPTIWLEQFFEKIYGYTVVGSTCVDTTVIINGTKFSEMHVVYGGGYEMVLAKRIIKRPIPVKLFKYNQIF